MRRERAQLRLRTLRVHPNGAVGLMTARPTFPSPGDWSLELSGAPDALLAERLEVRALSGRMAGLAQETEADGGQLGPKRLWLDIQVGSAGPVEILLEARLGWASWRCASQCIQRRDRLDWSTWAEIWLQHPLDPEDAALELSTRSLPGAAELMEARPNRVQAEISALAATRGGADDPLAAAEHPDTVRLLDPEPAEALGRHASLRPKQWLLGPDGRGRARLSQTSTPLPEACEVVTRPDGRPMPRLRWNAACPLPDGMPAGPLRIEALGRPLHRTLSRWPAGVIRALDLGPDPRVSAQRTLRTQTEGPRREVELELMVRSHAPAKVRWTEIIPRSVDPQLRVELYALEPRDTAVDPGLLRFAAELPERGVERMSTRYAVSCPEDHHPVRVPEGPR